MKRLLRIATSLVLLSGAGCAANAQPYVILRIQDPLGMGAQATMIRVTDAAGNASDLTPASTGFPMTLTLTSERKGPQRVTVDLYTNDVPIVRGVVSIDFAVSNTKVIEVDLVMKCAPLGSVDCGHVPVSCSTPADCDDGIYCNGAETCVGGECGAGSPPCNGKCVEATGCVVVCGGDQDCVDNLNCNGTESCNSGTCVPGTPLATPDDTNVCAPTICDEVLLAGVTFPADGTSCAGGAACFEGQCVPGESHVTCAEVVSLETQAIGTILGGGVSPMSIGSLTFMAAAPSGYDVTWRVVDGGIRGHEIQPFGEAIVFVFQVTGTVRLGSARVRSADGSVCKIESNVAIADLQLVRDVDYATIVFDTTAPPSPSAQTIGLYVQCPSSSAGAGNLRLTHICLVARAL